jgi:hypothetical protein
VFCGYSKQVLIFSPRTRHTHLSKEKRNILFFTGIPSQRYTPCSRWQVGQTDFPDKDGGIRCHSELHQEIHFLRLSRHGLPKKDISHSQEPHTLTLLVTLVHRWKCIFAQPPEGETLNPYRRHRRRQPPALARHTGGLGARDFPVPARLAPRLSQLSQHGLPATHPPLHVHPARAHVICQCRLGVRILDTTIVLTSEVE